MDEKKALVVDDMYDSLQGAMDFAGKFSGKNYSFEVAQTADEGLEKILSFQPQIIFLDKNFEDGSKDGVYFIKELKTNSLYEQFKNIPVIGIGSFDEDELHHLTEFDPKPLSYKNFEDMIEKYVK